MNNLDYLRDQMKCFIESRNENGDTGQGLSFKDHTALSKTIITILNDLTLFITEMGSLTSAVHSLPQLGQFLGCLHNQPLFYTEENVFQASLHCILLIYSRSDNTNFERNLRKWIHNQLRTVHTKITPRTICGRLRADRQQASQTAVQELQKWLKVNAKDKRTSSDVNHQDGHSVCPSPLETTQYSVLQQLSLMRGGGGGGEINNRLVEKLCDLEKDTSTLPPSCLLYTDREWLESQVLTLVETVTDGWPMLPSALRKLLTSSTLCSVCAEDETVYTSVTEILGSLLVRSGGTDNVIVQLISALHHTVLTNRSVCSFKGACVHTCSFLHPQLQRLGKLHNCTVPGHSDSNIHPSVYHLKELVEFWPDRGNDLHLQSRLQINLVQMEAWFYYFLWQTLTCEPHLVDVLCQFLCCYMWPLQVQERQLHHSEILALVLRLRDVLQSDLDMSDIQTLQVCLPLKGGNQTDPGRELCQLLMISFILQAEGGLKHAKTLLAMVTTATWADNLALLWRLLSLLDKFTSALKSWSAERQEQLQHLLNAAIHLLQTGQHVMETDYSLDAEKSNVKQTLDRSTQESILKRTIDSVDIIIQSLGQDVHVSMEG